MASSRCDPDRRHGLPGVRPHHAGRRRREVRLASSSRTRSAWPAAGRSHAASVRAPSSRAPSSSSRTATLAALAMVTEPHRPGRDGVDDLQRALQHRAPLRLARPSQRRSRRLEPRHLGQTEPRRAISAATGISTMPSAMSAPREFVEVVIGLWDSWDDDAFVRDKAQRPLLRSRQAASPRSQGEHFKVRGPLNVARSPQGRPVHRPGRRLGGRPRPRRPHRRRGVHGAQPSRRRGLLRRPQGAHGGATGARPTTSRSCPASRAGGGGNRGTRPRRNYEELQALIPDDVGVAVLSSYLSISDLPRYPIDGPLPELPESEGMKSRQALVVEQSRRDGLSIRQLARHFAGARGHWRIVGTAAQVADEMAGAVRRRCGRRLQRHAVTFPGRARCLCHAGRAGTAAARPVPHRVRRHDTARIWAYAFRKTDTRARRAPPWPRRRHEEAHDCCSGGIFAALGSGDRRLRTRPHREGAQDQPLHLAAGGPAAEHTRPRS